MLPLLVLAVGVAMFAFVGTAGADEASDPRAEFVDAANATTCEQGDSSPSILSGSGNNDASNADVSGDVSNNGTRDVLNVTVLNPAIQVNAVVVKGGNGYNVYRGNFPDMITPNNNGRQPGGFSHWSSATGRPSRHRRRLDRLVVRALPAREWPARNRPGRMRP
jgi:hypothetical protein